jgi:hypothetical protein
VRRNTEYEEFFWNFCTSSSLSCTPRIVPSSRITLWPWLPHTHHKLSLSKKHTSSADTHTHTHTHPHTHTHTKRKSKWTNLLSAVLYVEWNYLKTLTYPSVSVVQNFVNVHSNTCTTTLPYQPIPTQSIDLQVKQFVSIKSCQVETLYYLIKEKFVHGSMLLLYATTQNNVTRW